MRRAPSCKKKGKTAGRIPLTSRKTKQRRARRSNTEGDRGHLPRGAGQGLPRVADDGHHEARGPQPQQRGAAAVVHDALDRHRDRMHLDTVLNVVDERRVPVGVVSSTDLLAALAYCDPER